MDSTPQDLVGPLLNSPMVSTLQDLMDPLSPSLPQDNVNSSKWPVSNAALKSTKYQVPVIPPVAKAIPSPSVAALWHADSATNAMSDDIVNHAQPHQAPCFSTVPTAFARPHGAPDPIPGVTLLKPSDLYD